MKLLRASLVLVITAALGHQPPFHSQIISFAPDATVFRDRTGYAHTQILPSGPNYPQRVRFVTEAHHVPVVHHPLVAHHPIIAHHPVVQQAIVPVAHHAPPPVLVTVQKAASPVVYHSYTPITAYAKPAAYEAHYPAALAYKPPLTTTKVILPHAIAAHQATFVAPVPTGRAVVTSYFNVPGGGRRADDANFPSWTRTPSVVGTPTVVADPLVSVGATGARVQGHDPMPGTDVGWPVASAYRQSAWPARLVAVSMKKRDRGGLYRPRYPVPTRLDDWPFQSSSLRRSGLAETKPGWNYENQAQFKWPQSDAR